LAARKIVKRKMKKTLQRDKGLVIWMTGLPCSGKTTLAKELENHFKNRGLPVQNLDGDVVRKTINKDLGFSKKDRDINIERVAYISQMLANNGVNVIVAFVSPYEKMRRLAKSICPNFIQVYVKCDLEECIRRDTKGMYKKALDGKIKDFTGVDDPYEEPKEADIILKTDKYSLEESVGRVIKYLGLWKS